MFTRRNILFFILLILSIIFILGNNEDRTRKAQFIGKTIMFPFTSSISYIKNLSDVYQRNKYLHRELILVQNELRIFKKELSETKRLEELVTNIDVSKYEFIIVDVIGTGSFVNFETLIINAGKDRNIERNQPIISEKGLVGKVISVYSNYAIVQTFGNKYFRLGAIDSRSRIHGIVTTGLDGKTYFERIKLGSDLKIGDVIQSSKLSSIFPPEIPFGKIVQIEQSSEGMFTRAEIQPFVNLANLEAVAVIQSYE